MRTSPRGDSGWVEADALMAVLILALGIAAAALGARAAIETAGRYSERVAGIIAERNGLTDGIVEAFR